MKKFSINDINLAVIEKRYEDAAAYFKQMAVQNKKHSSNVCNTINKKTVMLPLACWLNIDIKSLYFKLYNKNIQLVLLTRKVDKKLNLKNITPQNYTKFNYKGVNLYKASTYSICDYLEKGEQELNTDKLEDWITIKTHMEYTAKYADYIDLMCKYFNPHKFVFPQGHIFYSSVMRQIALTENIEIIATENTLHKNKILVERTSGITVNRNSVKNKYWRYKDIINIDIAKNFVDSYFSNISKFKQDEHTTPNNNASSPIKKENGRKNILFLAQVSTDTSVLFDIHKGFNNQADAILATAQKTLELNQRLIIKIHPKEIEGISPAANKPYANLTLRRLKKNRQFKNYLNNKNIIVDSNNEHNTYNLIKHSDICITINSQSGLEALLLEKSVILCGNSFYSGMGWTDEAKDKQDLDYFIEKQINNDTLNQRNNDIDIFFYTYLNYSCVDRDIECIENLFAKDSLDKA